MEKLGEYITYDQEFFEKVIGALTCYQLLGIDTKRLLLKEVESNEMIQDLFSKYLHLHVVSDTKYIIPRKMNIQEISTLANDILISLFPSYKECILEYDELLYFYDDLPFDFGHFTFELSNNKIVPSNIDLSNNFTEYSIGVINHEKTHALVFEKMLLNKSSGIYMELLPMLIQTISNYMVENMINSNQIILIDNIVRVTDNQKHIDTLDSLSKINLSCESVESHFVFQYLDLKANDYLLAEWYSELLFQYYLVDSKKMIQDLNQVLKNEITIHELLNHYQINLQNKELGTLISKKLDKVKYCTVKL